ncbi:MAG: pseudouridine synthase [Gammaproteobacteria bacterium]|nr:pseudouridine synthase [Gammaproteobacteria bacterium]
MNHYTPPPDNGLDLLYLDDWLMAVNKPSGLLSVPGKGEDKLDSLSSRVQQLYPEALVVHRLDMPTSGIMLMARSKPGQIRLGQLFEQRQISKTYTALINGQPSALKGRIDLPLICDWPNRPRQMVSFERGKTAQTDYQILEYDSDNDCSRVQLTPLTGRSHQLRVHMQALGHPILGDELYASETACNKADRLLLHAEKLAFQHPFEDTFIQLSCPTPF